jgi:hypothetical protein
MKSIKKISTKLLLAFAVVLALVMAAAGTPGGVQPGGPRARFRQPRGRVRSHRTMPPGGGRRVLDRAGCESSFAAIRR